MGCTQPKNNIKDPTPALKKEEHHFANISLHALKQNYELTPETKVLGCGSYGKVYLSNSKRDPSHKVAIKVLIKEAVKD